MRQFRVVLRGPGGGGEVPPRLGEAGLCAQLGDYSSSHSWFRPEAVRVRLSRSLRAVLPPADWEVPLLGRAAAVTLATVGVLGGLSGTAQASPQALMPLPPGLESSSQARFMPTDRTPEVVLLQAREVRGGDSLRFTPGAPLTDERGNPILIAAYHSNLPGSNHSNAAGTTHTNTYTPHGNTQGTPHANTFTPHTNTAQVPHTNTFAPHTNTMGKPHVNTSKAHANTPPVAHVNTFEAHANAHPSSHTNAAWPNHSNLPGTHTDTQWQNHGNIPDSTGGFHTNMVQGDYVF